jgi:hypothetical protein
MKFKDWITWIFVRPITKKPVYYKRKDGTVTLIVKNCDKTLEEIDDFWESVSTRYPDLSFAGLRTYDKYWDSRSVSREPDDRNFNTIDLGLNNFYVYLISDKTDARRKLDIYSVDYTFKGKGLVVYY